MSFDLEAHLKNHAFIFKKNKNISPDAIHFNFSFLDLQFLGKNVEQTMSSLLDALLLPASYKVANGKRKDKHGNLVQKFTIRQIDLSRDIQAMAIHLKGPEGEDTMPHIHFIAKGTARFGSGFSLLKKHVSVISEQFNLLPNFDEIAEHNPLSVKSLSHAVSQITWSWKKSTNDQLKKEITNRGLDKSISLLESYCLKTKNLTYYIKSMEGLKTRLNRMKLEVHYKNHNLRNTYPIPLTKEDISVISLIQNKHFTQKDIKPYLKNPIFRDFIRHSAKTTKPYIYDALKEQTTLLDGVYKNKLAVDNYSKLTMQETPLRKSQLTPKDNQKLSRKNELRRIILEATKGSINEKTFKSFLQKAGYVDFDLKKKQGKVIGCTYKEIEAKKTVHFTDLGLHWAEHKKTFILNSRKLENMEILPTPTLIKKSPTLNEIKTSKKRTKTPEKEPIAYKDLEIKRKKKKAEEGSITRRFYEKLIPKLKTKIEKIENFIAKLRRGISSLTETVKIAAARIGQSESFRENYIGYERKNASEEAEESSIEAETQQVEKLIRAKEERESSIGKKHKTIEMQFAGTSELQRTLESGDYEIFLCDGIEENIRERRDEVKNIEIEIKNIETKQKLAVRASPKINKKSLSRGPKM